MDILDKCLIFTPHFSSNDKEIPHRNRCHLVNPDLTGVPSVMVWVFFFMKEIKLTHGYVALVDDIDYDSVNRLHWHIQVDKKTAYARAYNPSTKKQVRMHRLILGLTDKNILGDHIDGNGLNNQRSNLRTASFQQNARNMINHKGGKYKGVSRKNNCNRYEAYIRYGGRRIYLGLFVAVEDAALAYNEAAIKYHGEFAKLNIIDKHQKHI